MEKLEIKKPLLHILICVNDRSHLPEPKKPDCLPKINLEELKELKKKYKEQGVKITQTKCLGVCPKEGFIIMIYPQGETYRLHSIKELEELIQINV